MHPTAALNPEACREEIDLCVDAGRGHPVSCVRDQRLQLQAGRVDGWPHDHARGGPRPRLRGDPVRQGAGGLPQSQPDGFLASGSRVAEDDRVATEGGRHRRAADRRHLRRVHPGRLQAPRLGGQADPRARRTARDPQPQRLRARDRRPARRARGRRRDPRGLHQRSRRARGGPEPRRSSPRCSR